MRSNRIINNFAGGELSPRMYARVELPVYDKSVAKCENFIIALQGGARFRNGNAFANLTNGNQPGYLFPFQFNDQQSYLVEATNECFRFFANNGIVCGTSVLITKMAPYAGATRILSRSHGLTTGNVVTISGVNGVSGVNGQSFTITVINANVFSIPINTVNNGTYKNGGTATLVTAITGVTAANPGVFTSAAHGLSVGNEVLITGIVGTMSALNGQFFLVGTVPTANTFTLTDLLGNAISTVGLTYASGGSFAAAVTVTTPYQIADIPFLQISQDLDVAYITAPQASTQYAPQLLTRVGGSNFTLAPATFTGGGGTAGAPWTSPDYPKVTAFIPGERLAFADTPNFPESIWCSESPSVGNTAYTNFNDGGGSPTDTSAVYITLAPQTGKSDAIQWISVTNQFAFLGCFGSLRALYGASQIDGVDANDINAPVINFFGCAPQIPVTTGESMFYIQRGNRILRNTIFNVAYNSYESRDMTLGVDHLTVALMQQIVFQQNIPDVLWSVRGDGRVIGMTYSMKEDIAGWHRHYFGGNSVDANGNTVPHAQVLSLGIMPRPQATDQLWMVVERVLQNGTTVYSVEYMTDEQNFPNRQDFYSGPDVPGSNVNRLYDDQCFANAIYEVQKQSNHLDMATFYDGSVQGNITMTPAAVSGNAVNLTASSAFFTNAMIGQQIWKKHNGAGLGAGKATILSITSSTVAVCEVIVDFDNTNTMTVGNWYLTATVLSGLSLWNGETLNLFCDGGPAGTALVANGQVALPQPTSVAACGYDYDATLTGLNLNFGGMSGPAQAKMRRVSKCAIRFLNSMGAKFGTDPYRLENVVMRAKSDLTDRPVPPKSYNHYIDYADAVERDNKQLIVYHDQPTPLTVLSFDAFLDVNEDAPGQR